jgi:hypothetical protein
MYDTYPEIIAISHQNAQNNLTLSKATYSRYLSACHHLAGCFENWDYIPGSKSLSVSAFKILQIYQQLVSKFGVQYAQSNLSKELENHGYQKTNDRNNQQSRHQSSQQSDFTEWVKTL